MEDWGKGMLMSGREYDQVHAVDEELGMRELRAKVNGKLGNLREPGMNRFSINAEFNYGFASVIIVRKYLDSGMLAQYVNAHHFDKPKPRNWNGAKVHLYMTLIACVMSVGAKLPDGATSDVLQDLVDPTFLKNFKKSWPAYTRFPLAISQFKTAVTKYQEGTPHCFNNKTFLEWSVGRMIPGETTLHDHGTTKLIEVKLKDGEIIPSMIGAPDDEEMGLKHAPVYPADVCARCGEKESITGKVLKGCSRCHDRKYCSKECQKKHWKIHKIICNIPTAQMDYVLHDIDIVVSTELAKAAARIEKETDSKRAEESK